MVKNNKNIKNDLNNINNINSKNLCLVYVYSEKTDFLNLLKTTVNQYKNMGVNLKILHSDNICDLSSINILPAVFFYKNNKIIYRYHGNIIEYVITKLKQFLFNISI